jgi:hypothetical protein
MERAGEEEEDCESMASSPDGRDTEFRRWGTRNVSGGGFSNCSLADGGGNLVSSCGGGEGEETIGSVTVSPPLSLSAQSIASNPTDTACC